jgi:hypothetical protein
MTTGSVAAMLANCAFRVEGFEACGNGSAPALATGAMPHKPPANGRMMTQSTRKLLGTFLTLIGLVVYCALAITLYSAFLANAATPVQLVYFAVAGLGWALPTAIIIRWMARPDVPSR